MDDMQTRIPDYDDYAGLTAGNGVNDLGIAQPARDPAYDGLNESRWDDDQESSSRQGPFGMSVSSAEVPKEEVSMTAAEAAKSRSFRALRTAKACDVSIFSGLWVSSGKAAISRPNMATAGSTAWTHCLRDCRIDRPDDAVVFVVDIDLALVRILMFTFCVCRSVRLGAVFLLFYSSRIGRG